LVLGFKAAILGVVEGLTEFVPVSSTGHLIVAGHFVAYPEPKRTTFEIFIQLGAILAVVWHYRRSLTELVTRTPNDPAARNLILNVLLAFLPAACVGLLFHAQIERYLFNVPTVAAALILGGVAILMVEQRQWAQSVTAIEHTGPRMALWVGTAQILALFPGVSRAGATIIGGLLVGMNRPVATQFSFYLALPTITAASMFSLIKALPELRPPDAMPLAIGFATSFVAALVVIRVFISYVQSHDFKVFGYYRIFVGLLLFLLWGAKPHVL